MKVVNPATEYLLRDLDEDDAESVAEKAAAAHQAQPAWARTPLQTRCEIVRRFGSLLSERKETLARTLTSEMGKPIRQSRNELTAMQTRIGFFLEHTERAIGDEVVYTSADQSSRLDEVIRYEPLGVVANISAWNYPYFVGSNVFLPALLTGNTVLYKPSEHATLTGLAIADLFHEAGLPNDVFIPIVGAADAGAALLAQDIDAVFFTGSYATGRRIAESVAPRLIRVQLELGGKDPAYVCDDVDVSAAAAALADGAFYNAGQSCCAVERIYVEKGALEPFVEAFLATVAGFKLGDPEDSSTYIGPLARAPQLELLSRQIADAVQRGARVLTGGQRVGRKGNYFQPTVIASADNSMRVMRDESFGPIIGIAAVDDDDDALRQMNDTEYGLTAGVYTRDRARAEALLSRVDSGSVYWNCCDRVSPRLPWTGRRHSGLGSTLSTHGIRSFLQPKAWHLRNPQ